MPGMQLTTLAGPTLTIGLETASGSLSLISGVNGNGALISIANMLTSNGVLITMRLS